MDKLVFLGIAGNDAVTSQGLSAAGIILQYKNYQIHLDPGPGALTKAREFGINTANTNIILATHNHLTHCNDINLVIEAMTFKGLDQRGMVVADESVIHGTNLERPIIVRAHSKFLEKQVPLKATEHVKLPSLTIQALQAEHSCPSAIGFKISTDEFTIIYSGDTKFTENLPILYKKADIIILNTPFARKTKNENNLSIKDAASIINITKPRLAVLTHFSKSMLRENPLYEAREIQRGSGVQTIIAREGLSLAPKGYAERVRQKTLM